MLCFFVGLSCHRIDDSVGGQVCQTSMDVWNLIVVVHVHQDWMIGALCSEGGVQGNVLSSFLQSPSERNNLTKSCTKSAQNILYKAAMQYNTCSSEGCLQQWYIFMLM